MNDKILMIINAFPPSGESGVQRPLKFLKYFSRDGWETFVVTPRKAVLQQNKDVTLEKEIPPMAHVFKTHNITFGDEKLAGIRNEYAEPEDLPKKLMWKPLKFLNDLLFPIDKQIGWVPFAVISSIRIINKFKVRNLYITGSPFSAFFCGVILKSIYGKKLYWIADYRDAWQFAPLLDKLVLPFRKRIIVRMDEKFLRNADFVVFTSPDVLEKYRTKYPWLMEKSDCITNGYDEDDFINLESKQFDKLTFGYMGKLNPARGNPIPWLRVLKSQVKEDFQVMHVGIIDKSFLRQIQSEGLSFYNFIGYKSHLEALSYSAGTDVNIIVLNDDIESAGVLPGKIFELIRLGKPILAIGSEQSAIKDIITATGAGAYATANDTGSLIKALEQLLDKGFKPKMKAGQIEQYSRKSLTQKLAAVYQRYNISK